MDASNTAAELWLVRHPSEHQSRIFQIQSCITIKNDTTVIKTHMSRTGIISPIYS